MTAFYIGRAFFVVAMGRKDKRRPPARSARRDARPAPFARRLGAGSRWRSAADSKLFLASAAPSAAAVEHAPLIVPIFGTAAALIGLCDPTFAAISNEASIRVACAQPCGRWSSFSNAAGTSMTCSSGG